MNHVVNASVELAAPPDAVWRGLTVRAIPEKYFFKSRVLSTWKEGSPIAFERKFLGLFTFRLEGTVVRAEPNTVLQYRLRHHKFFGTAGPDEYSEVKDTLTPNGKGGTILSIRDDVGISEGADKRCQRSVQGWKKILEGLQDYLKA